MAAEDTLPYGRSPSRGASSFEQRSFSSGTKLHQKTAIDKLVWFSPVRSPLLSPGREKTMQITKKKPRQSSIFSIPNRSKGAIETEEPTSPKVSCIGQVRGAHKKPKDQLGDTSKKKPPQWKPGSASPARFFASPGRSSKWGSLFGSRKEGSATPSLSGYGREYEPEKQSKQAGPVRRFYSPFDPYTRAEADLHTSVTADSRTNDHAVSSKQATYFAVGSSAKGSGVDKHAGFNKLMEQQNCHAKSRQRLTYEELPSLHSGASSSKQSMKISVEVVPETWLWRDGEKLRPDGMSHAYGVCASSTSMSREELAKAQEDVAGLGVSSCSACYSPASEANECLGHQRTSDTSQDAPSETNEVGLVSDGDFTCERIRLGNCKNSPSHHVSMGLSIPSYTCTLKEGKENATSSCSMDRASVSQDDNEQALHREKRVTPSALQKDGHLLGSVEVNAGLQVPMKAGHDGRKQSHGLALPQPVEKKMNFTLLGKENRSVWSVFKDKKSQAPLAPPFGALILVGYGSQHQLTSLKDAGQKVSAEEILRGVYEVGRLSFHGREKHFQVLKGDAEFIRSRSATSHRTVIRLQRCNSDPCRPAS